jgi:phosphoglycolate phosphatase
MRDGSHPHSTGIGKSKGETRRIGYAGRMMAPRFVLWDLDGTLVDSSADIAAAANAARAGLGLEPLPERVVRSFVGEGAVRLMEQVLADAPGTLERGLALFFDHYERHPVDRTRPYAGIDALVRALAGRQGIATNKPAHLSRTVVERLGWAGLFVSHVGAGDVARRKPAPDPLWRALELAGVARGEAVFVGDSSIDVDAARAAGVDCIAVSWGLRPRHELLAATVVVDTPAELEEALVRLSGGGAC